MHHSLARALWSLKDLEAILGDQLADWSDKETKEFWLALMESHHYCWPIDAEGNIRRPYALLFPPRSRTSPTISGGR